MKHVFGILTGLLLILGAFGPQEASAQQLVVTSPCGSSGLPIQGSLPFLMSVSPYSGASEYEFTFDGNIFPRSTNTAYTLSSGVTSGVHWWKASAFQASGTKLAESTTCYFQVSGSSSLQISPSSFDFGNVLIGQSKTSDFTVQYSGLFLDSLNVSFEAPFQCVEGCGGSISGGSPKVIKIRFTPTSQGRVSRTLSVSGPSSFASATLFGTGAVSTSPSPTGAGGGSISIDNPLGNRQFSDILVAIINWIFTIALAISPIMIIYAGFLFVTGGGNPEQIVRGRNVLVWTFVGLAVIILSRGLIAILQGILGV